ncbi:hypothetical protein [Photorhabdus bodei]|uniref:Uncharacterized protein n=1 Tax=Photorhabdus bodei TaxID=2029681 RepID=A0ABX0AMU8_9GAMM|nr:hypothetical protein [Photorhabdus bodei]MCC8466056.1 hypothetical protein [Photorhabdus bodei]NDL00282.1 hypothetical protein [Photorhabdus bodei]NDL04370.1 hypothetical protein [Photorhabdus bodei]NDL08741.1 hypothetical protein [Photorhabdus bodei]
MKEFLLNPFFLLVYTLWISRCIAAARERIPGSIENSVTGVSECNQQRGNLKDDGYIVGIIFYPNIRTTIP